MFKKFMFKKSMIVLFLTITIAFSSSSCAYRRSLPRENVPVPEEQGQEETVPAPKTKDNLAKSDKDAIEENINGFDIQEDLQQTEAVQNNQVAQNNTGLSQQEAVQIRQTTGTSKINTILKEYQTILPDNIVANIQYNQYKIPFDYLLVATEETIPIRVNPTQTANVVRQPVNGEKLALLQRVEGENHGPSSIWYKVACRDNGSINTGYLPENAGVPRSFYFDKMLEAVEDLDRLTAEAKIHFISNYKNVNGAPPSKDNAAEDEFGYRIYQSAPGYEAADSTTSFRYLPDGIMVRLLGEEGDYYHVHVFSFNDDYYVPKQYIDVDNSLTRLSHVIVVDRSQQNQASFEIGENDITLVSYTLATTGLKGPFSFETPLGYYKALEKKERFQYLRDGSTDIAGYAPYAVRFTGGAYIHGVPVDYEEQDGEKIDPGTKEYLHTIGTFPRSHMCVRNFTSHANFLYEWMNVEGGAVIVIE